MKSSVVKIPPESLVVETDSPDQPLEGRSGVEPTWNEPAALVEVAQAVAALRGESPETVLQRSADNLRRVFEL